MKRRKRYQVGVRKEYFPKESWTYKFSSYIEIVEVLAHSRYEAAEKAWEENKTEWLLRMNKLSNGKRVSLEVNIPGVTGSIGRQHPILVYTYHKE